ncbi:MAG: aminoacyl-tRNA deacylase [Deltaproteobacteria bacterium]|nr:MAG: aminoacyl-tRNA deacylase [Deltaproteobacteria bacterium]
MAKDRLPTTQAIRTLKEHEVDFSLHPYNYEEKGGTMVAAKELGVDEHMIIKTLVMEDNKGGPFLILMNGDKKVSTKALARALGVKRVTPCVPQVAHRHTGYFVGGISPFGTRKPLRVFVEASIMDLAKIYINAGRKGLLAGMSPGDLARILDLTPVNAAI